MTGAPNSLAPAWLPRQQRRYIDHQLRKLIRPGVCSICGKPLRHNSATAGGLDAGGNVVLAGECCVGRVAVTFGKGLYSDRKYDFLRPRADDEPATIKPTKAQIADGIAAYQEVIAETDRRIDGVERRGGVRTSEVNLLDSPWKDDDRIWFEQNRSRSHRLRMPFAGEFDQEAAKTPTGHVLIVLVRQVEPGTRARAWLYLDVVPLPGTPRDEAAAHALFEVARGREAMPPDVKSFDALIEKYAIAREPNQ